MDEASRQAYIEKIPLRRVGTAQDQANVISFLSSRESSFLTGLTIDVTGGQF
jgi:NAD(P)-dependent dehydrogenase (short-subunit alcohol dehydrogenase family)